MGFESSGCAKKYSVLKLSRCTNMTLYIALEAIPGVRIDTGWNRPKHKAINQRHTPLVTCITGQLLRPLTGSSVSLQPLQVHVPMHSARK